MGLFVHSTFIYEHDKKYYVHVGAYTNIDTAKMMQEYFLASTFYRASLSLSAT